jgi:hypothetical protein
MNDGIERTGAVVLSIIAVVRFESNLYLFCMHDNFVRVVVQIEVGVIRHCHSSKSRFLSSSKNDVAEKGKSVNFETASTTIMWRTLG